MQLTAKQEEALKLAVARYNLGMPYTTIAGYAGAGKSTLVKFIVAALGFQEEEIAYVAYTGKAANVLKNKVMALILLNLVKGLNIIIN